jgi:hypothetical protein
MTDRETDLLRRAAARVREVAEAATPGPWTIGTCRHSETGYSHEVLVSVSEGQFADTSEAMYPRMTAEHIALCDPPFALAVADILAGWADDIEQYGGNHRSDDRCVRLARLILDEPGADS